MISQRRVELIIAGVLRTGVVLSLLIILAGALLAWVQHPDLLSSPAELIRLTQPGAAVPQTWREVVAGALALNGQAVVALGLLLLILTPILRVAVSVLAFLAEGDRTYVFITLAVLALLLVSLTLGKVGAG